MIIPYNVDYLAISGLDIVSQNNNDSQDDDAEKARQNERWKRAMQATNELRRSQQRALQFADENRLYDDDQAGEKSPYAERHSTPEPGRNSLTTTQERKFFSSKVNPPPKFGAAEFHGKQETLQSSLPTQANVHDPASAGGQEESLQDNSLPQNSDNSAYEVSSNIVSEGDDPLCNERNSLPELDRDFPNSTQMSRILSSKNGLSYMVDQTELQAQTEPLHSSLLARADAQNADSTESQAESMQDNVLPGNSGTSATNIGETSLHDIPSKMTSRVDDPFVTFEVDEGKTMNEPQRSLTFAESVTIEKLAPDIEPKGTRPSDSLDVQGQRQNVNEIFLRAFIGNDGPPKQYEFKKINELFQRNSMTIKDTLVQDPKITSTESKNISLDVRPENDAAKAVFSTTEYADMIPVKALPGQGLDSAADTTSSGSITAGSPSDAHSKDTLRDGKIKEDCNANFALSTLDAILNSLNLVPAAQFSHQKNGKNSQEIVKVIDTHLRRLFDFNFQSIQNESTNQMLMKLDSIEQIANVLLQKKDKEDLSKLLVATRKKIQDEEYEDCTPSMIDKVDISRIEAAIEEKEINRSLPLILAGIW
jgi:hypothetical protein